MKVSSVLVDAFDRIRDAVDAALEGLSDSELTFRPDRDANSIAWLVWHLTRIEDDHVCAAADIDQLWTTQGWTTRFALPFDPGDTGYGHDPNEVARVVCSKALLQDYHEAVHDRVVEYVAELDEGDLDRVVDRRWDPPVTLGVRLVSVIADSLEHVGQAAYVRGLVLRGRDSA